MTEQHRRTPQQPTPFSLESRTIVVTGAAQGIGREIAEQALALGANVVLVDRNAENLANARQAFPGAKALMIAGDVTAEGFAEDVVKQTCERFGAVHGLVNNAGATRPAMIEKMSLENWRLVLDVHLTGAFVFLQAVGRHMIERTKQGDVAPGSIVNVSSDAGVQGTVGQINYGVAKSGLLGASMSAAREWARYGIRVNSVAFGMIETPMTETVRGERFRDAYLAKIPLARWGTVREAALPVCFLLSDAASYVTGQRLSINGGSHMCA